MAGSTGKTAGREGDLSGVSGQRTGDQVKIALGALAVLALIVFFLQNRQEIDINFLWMEWNIGAVWALLASAITGALAALGFSALRGRRKRAAAAR
jgi:uncharacterized integral membrane protein